MRDAWPRWARESWRSMTLEQRERGRRVWTTLAETFGGALVGPGALVRHLVEERSMGHRSTLETIGHLVEHGLVQARPAAEGTILWVPEPLMPDETHSPRPRRPRFAATPRSNGTGERALAEA